MLLRIFFASLLLSSVLNAITTFYVNKIREDFHNKVVLEPLKAKYTKQDLIDKALKERDKKFTLDDKYFKKAKKHLWKNKDTFKHSQFITLIDLSKQVLIVTLWDIRENIFYPIGFDFISSGDINREGEVKKGEDHYVKTPAGLFKIKSGWRSLGDSMKKSKNTKPYGKKGRFVFFFGEQKSIRYNTFDKNGKKITDKKKWTLIKDNLQLAMHAHSNSKYFGQPKSHGCIRMGDNLNKFLDNNFVFFKHLLKDKKWAHPYENPPKSPKNQEIAGNYALIIDNAF